MPRWPNVTMPPIVTVEPFSLESIGAQLRSHLGISSSASAVWPTANLAIFVPFQLYQIATFVKMAVLIGATNGNNIDVGIFDREGNRLVSIGSTAQGSTNAVQTFDITDTTLLPGTYYLATACNGTTGAISRFAPTGAGFCASCGMLQAASAFPLPASVTYAACGQEYIPYVMATVRTVI